MVLDPSSPPPLQRISSFGLITTNPSKTPGSFEEVEQRSKRPRHLCEAETEEVAKLRIAVGSTNTVKVAAARAAFSRMFPDRGVALLGFDAASRVPAQPFGDRERTLGGAN